MLEWTASVTIAIEPVIAPATTFSTIRIVFETTDSRAAPNFVDPSTAAGAISGCTRAGAVPRPPARRRSRRLAQGSAAARAPRGRDG